MFGCVLLAGSYFIDWLFVPNWPAESTFRTSLSPCQRSQPITNSEALTRFEFGGMYGYTRNGERVTEPIYQQAPKMIKDFGGGINDAGQYVLIYNDGANVVVPGVRWIDSHSSEGRILFLNHNRYGYLDSCGRVLVRPVFDIASRYHDGYAEVGVMSNYQRLRSKVMDVSHILSKRYINKKGEYSLPSGG